MRDLPLTSLHCVRSRSYPTVVPYVSVVVVAAAAAVEAARRA
jgi:hypothetical protein